LLSAKPDWSSAKSLLGDANFLRRLTEYDKDNIPGKTIKKLDKYIKNPDFLPENVEKVTSIFKFYCLLFTHLLFWLCGGTENQAFCSKQCPSFTSSFTYLSAV